MSPRKPLTRTSTNPYHVFNRVNNKTLYSSDYLKLSNIWNVYIATLKRTQKLYNAKIHAFVLMGNHYHLLISTPDENIDRIIQYLQREVSKALLKSTESQNYRFQGRYKWKVVEDFLHYASTLKYIYRNPVDAGLCFQCHEYTYSTLHESLGSRADLVLEACSDFDDYVPSMRTGFEKWLSQVGV